MKTLFTLILGYIIGSIPTALIIGQKFYHTDVRKHGSGNLGGTNAGRVLGIKAGIIVIILDFFKCFIPMIIIKRFDISLSLILGLGVGIGHCYPIFANFKGGKVVACSYGFVVASIFFDFKLFFIFFIIPLALLLIIVKATGYVSLATMSSYLLVVILSIFFNKEISIYYLLLWLLMIYRHRENIKRLIKHNENKIKI